MKRRTRQRVKWSAGWLTAAVLAATLGCTATDRQRSAQKPDDSQAPAAKSSTATTGSDQHATESTPKATERTPAVAASTPKAADPAPPAAGTTPKTAEATPKATAASTNAGSASASASTSDTKIADEARKAASRDELREYIIKLAKERGIEIDPNAKPKPRQEQPKPANATKRSATAGKAPIASTRSQLPDQQGKESAKKSEPATPGTPSTPAHASAGCGDKGNEQLDLTPPPTDQPQPKFVAVEPNVTLDSVWKGEQAEFVWSIRNEGDAPLNIKLTKR